MNEIAFCHPTSCTEISQQYATRSREDARELLKLSTNMAIHRCAEKYR